MSDKPTSKQKRIAADLRRVLCGTDNPTKNELAQCRPIHVSADRVANLCGYAKYDDIPREFCDAVIEAGYDVDIAIACGNRTVIVGSDFEPAGAS